MPWKDGYTTSDEVGIRDSEITWPNDNRMALGLVVNLNAASQGKGITEKDLGYPTWHFGMHEGLDAFLGLFARSGVAATFAVPAFVAQAYPDRMETILSRGHEIAAQGLMGEDPNVVDREAESEHIDRAVEILTGISGESPKGWYALPRPDDRFATGTVTDATISLLHQKGFTYFGNGLADDAPYYWVSNRLRSQALLTLPYYYHFDDTFFLMFPRGGTGLERPEALRRNWEAEFAAQYRRGRYLNLTVSPARSGWGHRFDNLSAFLGRAMSYPGIWGACGRDIARHWLETHPPERNLKLAAPIWQDHADSIS